MLPKLVDASIVKSGLPCRETSMLPTLVLSQLSPFEGTPENLIEPAELRALTVPLTSSMFTGPALVLALTAPSQPWIFTVPAEDSATMEPFTPTTEMRPARVSRSRSALAGTVRKMSAFGPVPNMYEGQPQKPALARHLTVTTLPSCEALDSKSSGALSLRSTITSPSEPDLTSTDPGEIFATITFGFPATLKA